MGILWLGIIHDLSKFLPSEFVAYARNFYGGEYPTEYDIATGGYNGSTKFSSEYIKRSFDYAWNDHQKRNKHHWQYYVFREDDPETKSWAEWVLLANINTCFCTLPMPDRYRREMLADWRGAGRAITGKDNTSQWYTERRDGRILLHTETRQWIEQELGYA
jgi:hypothetical protein